MRPIKKHKLNKHISGDDESIILPQSLYEHLYVKGQKQLPFSVHKKKFEEIEKIFEAVIANPSSSTTCIILKGPTGCGKSFLVEKLIEKYDKFIRTSEIDSLSPSSTIKFESLMPKSPIKFGKSIFPALSFSALNNEKSTEVTELLDTRKVILRLTDAHFFQSIGSEKEYSHIRRAVELLNFHSGILLIEVTDFEFDGSIFQSYILKVFKELFPNNCHVISLNCSTPTIIKNTLEPLMHLINFSKISLPKLIEDFNGDSRAFFHDLMTISLIPQLQTNESLRDYRTDFFHYVGKLLYPSKTGFKIFDEITFWDIDYNMFLLFLQYYFPKFCLDLRLISSFFDQLCFYDQIPWKVLVHVSMEIHINACKYAPLLSCFQSINDLNTTKSTQKFFSFTRPPLINEGSFEIRKNCRKIGISPEEYYILNPNKP